MIIVEILLTIAAWSRYKWLALLPLGIAFGIGLLLGFGGVDLDVINGLWWIDVIAIITLIVMIAVKPKPVKEIEAEVKEKD